MLVRCLPCRVRDRKLSSLKLAWISLVCDGGGYSAISVCGLLVHVR